MADDLTVTQTSPGYWSVTDAGHDVHGRIVQLGTGYSWELHVPRVSRDPLQRTEFRTGPTRTLDEALERLRDEWPTELNDA